MIRSRGAAIAVGLANKSAQTAMAALAARLVDLWGRMK
jgi:hypothetical protein